MVFGGMLVNRFRFAAAALVFVGIMATTARVLACGGFFCQAIPINQAGERVVAGNWYVGMGMVLRGLVRTINWWRSINWFGLLISGGWACDCGLLRIAL